MFADNIFEITKADGNHVTDIAEGNNILWERASVFDSPKQLLASFRNTRRTGGDGTTYPIFTPKQVLPSVKVFGKTAKTIVIDGKRYAIPDDVELVDGVFSDNTNYFATFLNQTQADKWIIDIQFPTGTSRSLIGYSTDTGVYFGKDASDRYELGGNIFITPPPSAAERHTVVFDMTTSTTTLTVDGVNCTRTRQGATATPFRTVIPGYAATGNNVYSMLAYKGGVLVGAYYPCVKNGVAELYDFVSGKFCTKTGQPTAGKKTKSVRTKNLFDETAVTTGEFYNDSGVLATNAACYRSDNIPASQGDIITFSRESYAATVYLRIHAFKSDGTWLAMIGKSSETTSLSVTSSACPANTAYIVVCGAYARDAIDLHTMVVKGSTATSYIPYTIEVPLTELYGVGDKTANLFNNYEAIIEAGKTYTISATLTAGSRRHIYTYDADGTQIRDLVNWSSAAEGYETVTFTADAGEVKCKAVQGLEFISELQLEEGSTATSYIPYGYQVDTLLDDTLYTFYLDKQLNGVSTYEDTLTSNNDGTGQISGAMGVYEFTGNETFAKHASLAGLFFFNTTPLGALVQPTQQNYGFCSHYTAVQKAVSGLTAGECCFQALNATSNARFAVKDTNFDSVEELQAELRVQAANGTPWKIIFPLATPVTTPLTGLPIISLTEKAEHTLENENTVKGDMQVKYLGKE